MMRSTLALAALLLLGAGGCGPAVELGAVEIEPRLDCYRWGQSTLRQSRHAPQPQVLTFSTDGSLHLGGTPSAANVLRMVGRSGTDWVSSAGGILQHTGNFIDAEPWSGGGVVLLGLWIDGFQVSLVDEFGDFSSLAVIEFDKSNFIGEVVSHPDGFYVAGIAGIRSRATDARLWSFDRSGQELWMRSVPTAFSGVESWSERALAVRVNAGGGASIAVSDRALAEPPGRGGVRIASFDADGTMGRC